MQTSSHSWTCGFLLNFSIAFAGSVLTLCHLILLERYKMIYRTTDYTKSPSAVNLSFLRFTSIATTSEFCESSARNGTFRWNSHRLGCLLLQQVSSCSNLFYTLLAIIQLSTCHVWVHLVVNQRSLLMVTSSRIISVD